jgi:hypothetical protein
MGTVLMFDRRINAFALFNAFLFNASFSDGLVAQIQVNPEFGSVTAAQTEAEQYGWLIGQLPTVLRTDVTTVWIHRGVQPFGGGNNSILIHTDQAAAYAAGGVLEEVLVHESAHTSLDATHAASPGWLDAQARDADFISTYAMDNPTTEDIAESFLPWLALRHRSDRISMALRLAIAGVIPNRLSYFDRQSFDLFPIVASTPTTITSLTASPNLIWPPNHKMMSASLRVSLSGSPAVCQISVVTSNEPITGLGQTDWVITGPLTLSLRAERAGSGSGRIYTITVTCTNTGDLSTSQTVEVRVPHDRQK